MDAFRTSGSIAQYFSQGSSSAGIRDFSFFHQKIFSDTWGIVPLYGSFIGGGHAPDTQKGGRKGGHTPHVPGRTLKLLNPGMFTFS